jgi:hypothetical protein
VALLVFAIAYRFYGVMLADRALQLSNERITPAVKFADGHDYVATNKNVLFGHHFAAIAAAGLRKWMSLLNIKATTADNYGDQVKLLVQE